MFKRSFLGGVPFVLCSLLAAEQGGPAGGGAADAPVVPKTLAEAITMLGVANKQVADTNRVKDEALAENTRLSGLVDSHLAITKANTKTILDLRGEVAAHVAVIGTRDATIKAQGEKVTRLEALAVGAGLTLDAVIPPAPVPEAKETAADWSAKLAAAKGNVAQMQVLKDFRAAVAAGKVQKSDE